MPSKVAGLGACFLASGVLGIGAVLPKLQLPANSPVTVLGADYGDSSETARGGAMVVDLRAALTLVNSDQRRIRGITLVVTAQEVTPGGRGSVTLANLDVGPKESFPVRIDMRLLKPLQGGSGVPVLIGLDGVLFDDLSFTGPDKLGSKRMLTVNELEARRDRKYFKALFAEGGAQRVQNELLGIIQRQTQNPGVDVQMVRAGRSTNLDTEHSVKFAFLNMPDSPIQPLEGSARVAGNEARSPQLEVRNRSDRSVRYLEIGWILQDHQGREYVAGSVPAELNLGPGQKSPLLNDTTLRFPSRPGQALAIEGMTGFVSTVEYSDGNVWIPTRADLATDQRLRAMPSGEEQRLVQIYHKRGINGVVDELKKF